MLETIYITRHAVSIPNNMHLLVPKIGTQALDVHTNFQQVRPGVQVDHKTGIYTSTYATPTGIPIDPELTASGVQQSHELAAHLTKIEPAVDRIYSSPLYRCLQTLRPTSQALFAQGKAGGKIRIDRGLGEFYGKAPWKHASPATLEVLMQHFKDLDAEYVGPHTPPLNGELIQELHERVKNSIGHIIETLDKDPEGPKTLLICTHAATMICLGRALTGKMPEDPDEDDFQCFCASLSTFKRRSPELVGSWECTKNSDTSYLSEGAQRGW